MRFREKNFVFEIKDDTLNRLRRYLHRPTKVSSRAHESTFIKMAGFSVKSDQSDNVSLAQILNSTTKVNMLTVCKKFDLYVSPNLKKDETARRIAREVLDNPIEILSRLNKSELQIVDEFVKGNDDTYVVRKQRKTYYILQKYYLVLTYRDDKKSEWHMLMPREVRDSLASSLPFYLDCAMKGVKAPSAKELRMMSMLQRLYGEGE